MTELEGECVLAMKVDSEERHLVAGDSAGFIAVFNIRTYCTTAEVGRFTTKNFYELHN